MRAPMNARKLPALLDYLQAAYNDSLDVPRSYADMLEKNDPAKGAGNTIITDKARDDARNRLNRNLNNLSANPYLNPENLKDVVTIGAWHIEHGARTLAAFSRKMALEFGDGYLKIKDRLPEIFSEAMKFWKTGFKELNEGDLARLYEGTSEDPYTSKLRHTILWKMPARLPAEGIGKLLAGEASADELKWTGFDEYLKANAGKTLSQQEVLDYLRKNEVRLDEVLHEPVDMSGAEGERDRGIEEMREITQKLSAKGYTVDEGMEEATLLDPKGEIVDNAEKLEPEVRSLMERYTELMDRAYELDRQMSEGPVKFAGHTEPGGENYRELLLTLPGREGNDAFRTGHWSENNVLVHVRFKEDKGADGKRVLRIEEVQSDWHQGGRRRGYGDERQQALIDEWHALLKERAAAEEEATRSLREKLATARSQDQGHLRAQIGEMGRMIGRDFEERDRTLQRKIHDLPPPVPEAPFRNTWPQLALKRMIRYAAENGFDRIAWTTGEMQNKRYALEQHVSSIRVGEPRMEAAVGEPLRSVVVQIKADPFVRNGLPPPPIVLRGVKADGTIDEAIDSRLRGKNLSEVVGKELAQRILGEPGGHVIEGEGLKIGGEGMKAFYDQMLPAAMNKLAKTFGTTVQDKANANGTTFHSLDIPPELARVARQGMLPQFEGSLLSTVLPPMTLGDRLLAPITQKIDLQLKRLIGAIPESVQKYLRAPFNVSPEVRAAYEEFRQEVAEGRVDTNKLTRLVLGSDFDPDEGVMLDRILRGHPQDLDMLPADKAAKMTEIQEKWHGLAQTLTTKMQALGLPVREEWLNAAEHWYPAYRSQYIFHMVLGRLFGGGRQTRVNRGEAAHMEMRISDRYVVFEKGAPARDPQRPGKFAVYPTRIQAEEFAQREGGWRLTYVDKDTRQFVEEQFATKQEREALMRQLIDDDTAKTGSITMLPHRQLSIADPESLEHQVANGLLEDPLINIRRGLRENTGLVAKTRFYTVLGQVAALSGEEGPVPEGYVKTSEYFHISDKLEKANPDIERLANGYIPKALAEDLAAMFGPKGLTSQLYDLVNNAMKSTLTVYNPFRYAKQPIENELSLAFADSGAFLNKPFQAKIFTEYLGALSGRTTPAYDMFLKLGGDKEDFYTAEIRKYGRDLSTFRDVEGLNRPLSFGERMQRIMDENPALAATGRGLDLLKAIYHHEDIIYKFYGFRYWTEKAGMTPHAAMQRVQDAFFYGTEAPRIVQATARIIPFMPRVAYEFSRIMLNRLRDYPASTMMKLGLMSVLYATLQDELLKKAGWTPRMLAKMADAAPGLFDLVLPATDSRGRNYMLSLRWLIPYADLGMFSFQRPKDIASAATQLMPLPFRGAVATALGKTALGNDITEPGDPNWKDKYAKNLIGMYLPMMTGQYWMTQYNNAVEKDPLKKVPWYEKALLSPSTGALRHVAGETLVAQGQIPMLDELKFLEDEKRKIESRTFSDLDMSIVKAHNEKVRAAISKISQKYHQPVTPELMMRYLVIPGQKFGKAAEGEGKRGMFSPLERMAIKP